jgi:hypothetical protein
MKMCRALALIATGGMAVSANAQIEIVNNVPGTWIDISATGNPLVLSDDQSVQIFNTVSNSLIPVGAYVNSNGTIGLAMFSSFSNTALPNASFHGGTGLAPFWDDLNPALGGTVHWEEIGNTLIVQYTDIPFFAAAGEPNTFQVQIFGSGTTYAQFLYQGAMGTARQRGNSATIGAQLDSSTAVQYSFNQDVLNFGTVLTVRLENPSAVGACCFGDGTCQFITRANCDAGNGAFAGENVTCATANCPQPGACCLGDGTCIFVLETACGTAAGTWAGAGITCATANCPQPSACCFFDGTCSMLIPVECAAQGGTSLSGTCATASCPGYEIVENLPGVFTDISITGTFITNGDDSSVPFFSSVVNALVPDPNLFASTNGVISSTQFTSWSNTALPAPAAGLAFFPFWDDLFADPTQGGAVLHQAVVEGGINVHIVQWNNLRTFGGGSGSSTGTFQVKLFESGPVLAQYIYDEVNYAGTANANGGSATVGYQADAGVGNNLQYSFNQPVIMNGMVLSLISAGGGACYANCDGSTVAPILNVDDFTCFINEFAAAQSVPTSQQITNYANCDGSTIIPVLNVDDFTCFINQYAQGCP